MILRSDTCFAPPFDPDATATETSAPLLSPPNIVRRTRYCGCIPAGTTDRRLVVDVQSGLPHDKHMPVLFLVRNGLRYRFFAALTYRFFIGLQASEDFAVTHFDITAKRFYVCSAGLREVRDRHGQLLEQRCCLVEGIVALTRNLVFIGRHAMQYATFARRYLAAKPVNIAFTRIDQVIQKGVLRIGSGSRKTAQNQRQP
jgi:hypothetical protein